MTAFSDLKWDENSLIPVVVQDDRTLQVLMLAWMNEEALRQTLTTGYVHFWSRSRQELWRKGATSGNVMVMSEIWYDCDGDALLVRATAHGPACHTGEISCFYRQSELRRPGRRGLAQWTQRSPGVRLAQGGRRRRRLLVSACVLQVSRSPDLSLRQFTRLSLNSSLQKLDAGHFALSCGRQTYPLHIPWRFRPRVTESS